MTHPLLHRASRTIALAVAGLALAGAATAAPIYLVDATTDQMPPDASLGNDAFFLTYEDLNGDMRFGLDELLAFTGYNDGPNVLDQLLAVPVTAGAAGSGTQWLFGSSSDPTLTASVDASAFTLFTTALSGNDVPEPSALALACLALAGLGLSQRQRRRTQV